MVSQVFIPLTVGGGVRTVGRHSARLLNAGADKVSINTAAIHNPEFVREAAERFGWCHRRGAGRQARSATEGESNRWETHGGRKATGIQNAVVGRRKMADYGAEILLTSMDRDGHQNGFDLGVTRHYRCGGTSL